MLSQSEKTSLACLPFFLLLRLHRLPFPPDTRNLAVSSLLPPLLLNGPIFQLFFVLLAVQCHPREKKNIKIQHIRSQLEVKLGFRIKDGTENLKLIHIMGAPLTIPPCR